MRVVLALALATLLGFALVARARSPAPKPITLRVSVEYCRGLGAGCSPPGDELAIPATNPLFRGSTPLRVLAALRDGSLVFKESTLAILDDALLDRGIREVVAPRLNALGTPWFALVFYVGVDTQTALRVLRALRRGLPEAQGVNVWVSSEGGPGVFWQVRLLPAPLGRVPSETGLELRVVEEAQGGAASGADVNAWMQRRFGEFLAQEPADRTRRTLGTVEILLEEHGPASPAWQSVIHTVAAAFASGAEAVRIGDLEFR